MGSGFNVAVCALRFFYGVTLGRTAMVERIPYVRKRRQLPVILSAEEVVRFFAAVPNLKHRTALMTAYAAGLRVSEVVRLKLADVDSSGMLIRVDQGKGGRDRYIMLLLQLLIVLRTYRLQCLARHAAGDWGSVSDEDKAENDLSVKEGFRILSAYPIDPAKPCAGTNKLWIITEADRSVTTFVLPPEY